MSIHFRVCLPEALAGLLLAALWAAPPVGAESIFKYMDDRGVVHFSDAPRDARYSRVERRIQEGLAITPEPINPGPGTRDYDRLIASAAGRYRIQPALIKAVIAAESNFQSAPPLVTRKRLLAWGQPSGSQTLRSLVSTTCRKREPK